MGGGGGGGQDGCERRVEVFVKIQKKKTFGEGGGVGGVGFWGQDGCERRIEAIVKTQKKKNGGVRGGRLWGGGGVRVDVNEELKFL